MLNNWDKIVLSYCTLVTSLQLSELFAENSYCYNLQNLFQILTILKITEDRMNETSFSIKK